MPSTDRAASDLGACCHARLEPLAAFPPTRSTDHARVSMATAQRPGRVDRTSGAGSPHRRDPPEDLRHVERRKSRPSCATPTVVRGLPANNVLLTGARGTGKSSHGARLPVEPCDPLDCG